MKKLVNVRGCVLEISSAVKPSYLTLADASVKLPMHRFFLMLKIAISTSLSYAPGY